MGNPRIAPHRKAIIPVRAGRSSGPPAKAEVDALDLRSDLAEAIRLCCDGQANFRAVSLAAKIMDGRTKYASCAVYVVVPDDRDMQVAKVGVAGNPAQRLVGLQIGNWNKLVFGALVWFDAGAGMIETLVHKAADEMGIGVRGEWISASTEEACELVLKAARYANMNAYDSNIWIKNWSARTQALAEHRHYASRIAA